MDLFVLNRHRGDNEDEKIPSASSEQSKLNKILQRVEKNRRNRSKRKEREKLAKAAKQRTREARQIKRELKAKIIPVPENTTDEFTDQTVFEEAATSEQSTKLEGNNKKWKPDSKGLEGFTVLGEASLVKKQKVKRVLPKWLLNPTVIPSNPDGLPTAISDIKKLDEGICKLLSDNGVEKFFPVQAVVIPYLLRAIANSCVISPCDICVSAPTGSGKTLAYALPVIQALKKYIAKKIRALVILPTQDLATQVFKVFKTYSQGTRIDVGLVTGKNAFQVEQNQLIAENKAFGLLSKVDILVCTPGRLVDHLKLTKGFDLHELEFLIIDEADRVLENVQNDWLYHLEKHLSEEAEQSSAIAVRRTRPPQKLLFSATLSQDPEKLQKLSLFQPRLFTYDSPDAANTSEHFIGKYTTPKELIEKYVVTSLALKPLVLYKLINSEKLNKCIIFTHSVDSTHRLAILLRALFKDELKVEEISSSLQGNSRTALIEKFTNKEIDLLVCTDALARGIDIPQVQCVISYSAPKYLKTYIHRAGRTARAGEAGLAVTLLHKPQLSKFKAMLEQAGKTNVEELFISAEDLEPLEKQYEESLNELKQSIEKEGKMLKKNKSPKTRKGNK
ncbi:hypothetical protein NQ315_007316 [Exocentrus adspersus]|uniref:ATP-dependent RNA helicase n=1 Tax=Exocentrus adspersus TaxID=1586481 RepID=A0AAV8WD72_9CUCU|nr:hypothetical protein NQ315_007316 [Exocentrus adspersus]